MSTQTTTNGATPAKKKASPARKRKTPAKKATAKSKAKNGNGTSTAKAKAKEPKPERVFPNLDMDAKMLTTFVRLALTCASKDLTRQHLNCVQFVFTASGELRLETTDGHRALRITVVPPEYEPPTEDTLFPITYREAQQIATTMKPRGRDERGVPIHLRVLGNNGKPASLIVRNHNGTSQMTLPMLDTPFPPIDKVIPKASDKGLPSMSVSTKYLRDAGRVAAAFGAASVLVTNGVDDKAPVLFQAESKSEHASLLYVLMPMRRD